MLTGLMKQILYFSISIIILLYTEKPYAQERLVKDRGVRFGTDVSKFVLPLFYPETRGYELLADFQILDNIFIAGEYGISNTKLDTDSYKFNYDLNGSYIKLGLIKNILKHDDVTKNDLLFVGFRYSFSRFKHKASNISIIDEQWDEVTIAETEEISLSCHSIDLVAGVKTELFKNIYIGWTIRGMIRLELKSDNIMSPYFIPGFGKGDKNAAIGFNYSIYYRIPYKISVKEKNKEKGK
jgi:hypothetical protein